MLHARFWLCSVALHPAGTELRWFNWRECYIDASRERLVENALEWGADKIMFLDSDMTFPPCTLARLLEWNKDITGCTYVKRVPPHAIVCKEDTVDAVPCSPDGLIEMKAMPTGCLLIDAGVFGKLKKPWFYLSYKDGRRDGEDYNFCRDAREAGFKVWCDAVLSLEVGHLGTEERKIKQT
jgi:glycosyltransferase involved in cell wall biosynthesis